MNICPHCGAIVSMNDTGRTLRYTCGSTKTMRSASCVGRELGSTDLCEAQRRRINQLEEKLMDMKNKHAALVAEVALYDDRGERIKRLEEGGDEAIYKTNLFDREAHWFKAKEAKP